MAQPFGARVTLQGMADIRGHTRPVAKFLTKCYIVPDNYAATTLRGAR